MNFKLLLLLASFSLASEMPSRPTSAFSSSRPPIEEAARGWFSSVGDFAPVLLLPPTFVLLPASSNLSCELEGMRINRAKPRASLWPVLRYIYWKFSITEENRGKFEDFLTWFLAWPEPLEKLKQVVVDKVSTVFSPPSSGSSVNGREGIVKMTLNWTSTEPMLEGSVLSVRVIDEDEKKGSFQTAIVATKAEGWLIFSDIDDTIKNTGILDTKETLWNTFIRPFSPIKGMAQAYQSLRERINPLFVYCSASPIVIWQQLFDFLRNEQFPIGPMLMAQTTAYNFGKLMALKDLKGYKVEQARELRKRLPLKKWIMIGDSGQMDPAAYATIYAEMMNITQPASWLNLPSLGAARSSGKACIYIRAVSGVNAKSELLKNDPVRFMEDFRGIPSEDWMVFSDASELQGIDPRVSCYPPGKTNPIPAKARQLWEERGALQREVEVSEWARFMEMMFSAEGPPAM